VLDRKSVFAYSGHSSNFPLRSCEFPAVLRQVVELALRVRSPFPSEGGRICLGEGACVFRVRAGGIIDVQLLAPGRVYFVRWPTLAGGDFIS